MKPTWTPEDKKRVKEMTMRYIKELKEKGFHIRELEKIDFNARFNTHGYCRLYRDSPTFILGISVYRVLDGWEAVKETILHELCHAIASYDTGHGEEWQGIAKKVGSIYGIKITYSAPHSIKSYEIASRYVIKCDNCGATWRFMRRTAFVKAVMENNASASAWKCECGSHHFSMVKGGNENE